MKKIKKHLTLPVICLVAGCGGSGGGQTNATPMPTAPSNSSSQTQASADIAKQRADAEQARLAEIERQKAEAEKQRLEAERKKAEEAEKTRLAEEERQRIEAEKARLAEEEKQRIERERLAEIERQKIEAEKQRLEAERKKAEEAEKSRLAEEEKQRIERERLAEIKRQKAEAEKQRLEAERKKAEEAEKARLAEEEKQRIERKRLAEIERQKAEAEKARLAEEEKQRIERERLAELERQKAAEAEKQRLEAERKKAEDAEKARLAEEERQRIERERLAEIERQKAEAEKQRLEAERKKAEEAEKARLAEEERQRIEHERLAELERQKAEAEKARLAEEERQRIEAEKARLAEKERQRIERERLAELERQKAAEAEKQRLEAERKKAEDAEKARLAEEERQRIERERLAEIERQKAEAEKQRLEAERKKAEEAEKARLAEEERQRIEHERLAELERQKAEAEKARLAEEERQRIEAEKARLAEEERQRIERERLAELERQKAEAEKAKQANLVTQSEDVQVHQQFTAQVSKQPHSIAIMDTAFSNDKQVVGDIYGNRLTIFRNTEATGTAIGHNSSHGVWVSAIIAQNNQDAHLYGYTSADEGGYESVSVRSNSFSDAHRRGVRIFNLSFGRTRLTQPTTGYDLNNLARFAKNSIFVLAGGNESKNWSSNESHAVMGKPELKNGWLVVAAVPDHSNSQLAHYSNKIGDNLKNYGITAKGNWRVDFNGKTKQFEGTSFAAPLVSAAVAKVWDKFPWMDNHLTTMTILSTASKPNQPQQQTEQPDATFGWGILNESRALNGLGRLDTKLMTERDDQQRGLIRVHFDHQNLAKEQYTWSNAIAGDAGLLKQGTGTLFLTGDNRYTGDSVVEAGVLQVSQGLASNVRVGSQGHFVAKNDAKQVQLGKDVYNNGSLYVYGKGLNIQGNYTADGTARLVLDIDQATLNVQGTAQFNGSRVVADIEQVDKILPSVSQQKTVVSAGDLQGFDAKNVRISTNNKPYIELESIEQQGQTLVAKYKRNSTAVALERAAATTSSVRQNTGQNVDNALNHLSSQTAHNDAHDSYAQGVHISNIAAANLATSIDQLSGELHASQRHIALQHSQQQQQNIAQRFAIKLPQGVHSWANIAHLNSHYHQPEFANVKWQGQYINAGTEWRNAQHLLGVAVHHAQGQSDVAYAGSSKDHANGISIYAQRQLPIGQHQWSLAAQFGYQYQNWQTQRQLLNQTAHAKYHQHAYQGYAQLACTSCRLQPFVGYHWTQLNRSAFNEQQAFTLNAPRQTRHHHSYVVGIQAQQNWGYFGIHASLQHRYAPKKFHTDFTAQLIGSEQNAHILGIAGTQHQSQASVGIYYTRPQWQWSLQYAGTFARHQSEQHQVKLGGVYRWGK